MPSNDVSSALSISGGRFCKRRTALELNKTVSERRIAAGDISHDDQMKLVTTLNLAERYGLVSLSIRYK